MRLVSTSTLSNQDISPGTVGTTGLLIHTYTADADRMVLIRFFLDQIAGNGAYTFYRTMQRGGAGTAYRAVSGSSTVASGITSFWTILSDIPIANGDVMKFYLIGLAGDSVATADIITEIWELDPLRSTVPDRTLDVSATGEAGLDWANVGGPTTTLNLSGTTVKTATEVETDTADLQSRIPAALTGAGNIKADALALSGDATAADNAESFFDGTGYAGTNNVIPTVTTVNGLAADTVNANALAADAATEIRSGLSTLTGAGVRSALGMAAADLDAQLDALDATILSTSGLGTGAVLTEFTVNDATGQPLDGVLVEISTDDDKENIAARGYTVTDGTVRLNLDAGDYYLWKNLAGYDFENPEEITIS